MRALRHKYVHCEGFDFLWKNIFYLFLGLLCKEMIFCMTFNLSEAPLGTLRGVLVHILPCHPTLVSEPGHAVIVPASLPSP